MRLLGGTGFSIECVGTQGKRAHLAPLPIVSLNRLLRLHIPHRSPLLMGFRYCKSIVVRGQEIWARLRGAEHGFHHQTVIDPPPMRCEPHRKLANQLLVGFVEIKLDCFTTRSPWWSGSRCRLLRSRG